MNDDLARLHGVRIFAFQHPFGDFRVRNRDERVQLRFVAEIVFRAARDHDAAGAYIETERQSCHLLI